MVNSRLKFRAFVKHLGQLADVLSIDFLDSEVEIYLVDRDEIRKYRFGEDEIVLLPFTGLKDKSGIDIYEGDILLVTSEIYTNFGKTPTGRFSKEYYEVIWKDDGWGHKVLKSEHTIEGTEIKGLKVTTKYVEVIGNIYENPELLEESK